jgi:hypothetical protein
LPIRASRKSDYAAVGQLALTNRRLLYVAKTSADTELGSVSIAWSDVRQSELHHGQGKFKRAPRPYVFLWWIGRPMFSLCEASGAEYLFQLMEADRWHAAILQLRILFPVLEALDVNANAQRPRASA